MQSCASKNTFFIRFGVHIHFTGMKSLIKLTEVCIHKCRLQLQIKKKLIYSNLIPHPTVWNGDLLDQICKG